MATAKMADPSLSWLDPQKMAMRFVNPKVWVESRFTAWNRNQISRPPAGAGINSQVDLGIHRNRSSQRRQKGLAVLLSTSDTISWLTQTVLLRKKRRSGERSMVYNGSRKTEPKKCGIVYDYVYVPSRCATASHLGHHRHETSRWQGVEAVVAKLPDKWKLIESHGW